MYVVVERKLVKHYSGSIYFRVSTKYDSVEALMCKAEDESYLQQIIEGSLTRRDRKF